MKLPPQDDLTLLAISFSRFLQQASDSVQAMTREQTRRFTLPARQLGQLPPDVSDSKSSSYKP
ncbi:MAG: hypothetical protein HWD59_14420 [Coxiellaceae bacterium]|nr:MAG: hypothetical protein HWD59_14420 [Coxiellaceae bacterium]